MLSVRSIISTTINLFTILCILVLWSGPVRAAEPLPDPVQFKAKLVYWLQTLDQADELRDTTGQTPAQKSRIIRNITFIHDDAQATVELMETFFAEADSTTETGASSKTSEDQPNNIEPRILDADQRKGLSQMLLQASIVAQRAQTVLEEMGVLAEGSKWQKLIERGPPPLSPNIIVSAIPEILSLTATLLIAPVNWIADVRLEDLWQALVTRFVIGLIISIAIAWTFRNWLLRRYGCEEADLHPSYSRKLVATLVEAIGRGLMPALLIMIIVVSVDSLELLTGLFRDIVTAPAIYLIFFIAIEALARAALAPNRPVWRMTPFDDRSSRLLYRRIILLVGGFSILNAFADMTNSLEISETLSFFYAGLTGIVLAILMLPLLQHKAWQWAAKEDDEQDPPPSVMRAEAASKIATGWAKVRFILTIIIVLSAIAGLFGYINLTQFVLGNLLLSGILMGAVSLIRSLVQELINKGLEDALEPGHWLNQLTGIQRYNHDTVQTVGLNILDGILLLLSALILLGIWGFPPELVMNWLARAMNGIAIGSYVFSLTDFILAITAFAFIMLVTRAIQWLFDTRLLPKRLDLGIRQSIRLVVGYLGVILGLMVAVSTLGIDLTSIALVAGALSVGIGFGLQAIVGNFISGLILLFERPIKPGDWIVVGTQEGTVTRINVRSTELRTFQRASVIIPNSEVLSTSVINWTHKDQHGRVEIRVGIDYNADPEIAAEIMRKCGEEHPLVLKFPAPRVLFMNFGDSSQDLELRVILKEIEHMYDVGSDLRFAISKAFKEAGVVIPFPQRVVHIKTDDTKKIN